MMNKLHQCKLMLFTCMLMSGTAYAGYGGSYLAKSAENPPPNTTSKDSINRLSVKDNADILLKTKTNKNTSKLATICFITDTSDCQGRGFNAPGEDAPEWYPEPEKSCEKEGYTQVTCNSMETPTNKCPYDETYWEKCVCKSEFKETCAPPLSGIGTSCDGKYERCCKNECPAGHDTTNGACRQASSQKTECGNSCYKIVENTCKSGNLNAPSETGGYKNKIVGYTDCGTPCWQSYDDNCAAGSVKTKVAGKCYNTAVTYTPFGSACYKEISCCTPTCYSPWSLTNSYDDYIFEQSNCSGTYCYKACSGCPTGATGRWMKHETGVTNSCGKLCYYPKYNWKICFDLEAGVRAQEAGWNVFYTSGCHDFSNKGGQDLTFITTSGNTKYSIYVGGDRFSDTIEATSNPGGNIYEEYKLVPYPSVVAYSSHTTYGGNVTVRVRRK